MPCKKGYYCIDVCDCVYINSLIHIDSDNFTPISIYRFNLYLVVIFLYLFLFIDPV